MSSQFNESRTNASTQQHVVEVQPKGEDAPQWLDIVAYERGSDISESQPELLESLFDTYRLIFAKSWGEGWVTASQDIPVNQEVIGDFYEWVMNQDLASMIGFPRALIEEDMAALVSDSQAIERMLISNNSDLYTLRELYIEYLRSSDQLQVSSHSLDDVLSHYYQATGIQIEPNNVGWSDLLNNPEFKTFLIENRYYSYYSEPVLRRRFQRYLNRGPLVLLKNPDNKCVGFAVGEIATLSEIWDADIAGHVLSSEVEGLMQEFYSIASERLQVGSLQDIKVFNFAELGILQKYAVGLSPLMEIIKSLLSELEKTETKGIVGWTDMSQAGIKPSVGAFVLSRNFAVAGNPDGAVVFVESLSRLRRDTERTDLGFVISGMLNLAWHMRGKFSEPARRVMGMYGRRLKRRKRK